MPEVNLEGAVLDGDRLLLFNRGNMAAPYTQIIESSISAVLAEDGADAQLVGAFLLPDAEGISLTVTDACLLQDGRILLSAVAEVTDNSYADGALMGAAFVLLDSALQVIVQQRIEPPVKIEGICAQQTTKGLEILCVTDADDPVEPAALYRTTWQI